MEKNDHQEFINNNTTDHGKKKQSIESKNISTLIISGKYNAATICSFLSITEKEFEEYNPHFNQTLIKTGSYELLLPLEKMELFKQKKYDILNECVRLLLE
jgi:membrane-bound lytic murein transglycosylase D